MINCQDYSPAVYKDSRDYKAFLTLLDSVINISKYEIDNMTDLYDPLKCKYEVLPFLAEMMGYEYNVKDSIDENRVIIDNFSKLLHYRGSETGIKLAASLSLNSVGNRAEIADLRFLEVLYDRENGIIYVVYPRENTKVRNLIDWVRPVGMAVELLAADQLTNLDKVQIGTNVEYIVRKFQNGHNSIDYAVEKSEVSLGALSLVASGGGGTVDGNTWNDLLANNTTWNTLLETETTWNDFLES